MIKINDRYSFKRGTDCWILYIHCETKQGSKKDKVKKRYYVSLDDMYTKVLADSALGVDTLTTVLMAFNEAREDILNVLHETKNEDSRLGQLDSSK